MNVANIKFSLVLSLLVLLVSCQEQEFYEKEFLEGVGVEKPTVDNDNGGIVDMDNDNGGIGDTDNVADTDNGGDTDNAGDTDNSGDNDNVADTDNSGDTDNAGDTDNSGDNDNVADTDNGGDNDNVGDTDNGSDNDNGGICGNGELLNASDTFTQNEASAQKVDILWVIDNSGSMREEQQALADNFDTFIRDFITKEIDFKMAITTTDPRSSHNGNVIGNPDNLTSEAAADDEAKFLNDFSNNVQVGINGSGNERGLQTSASFMTKYPSFVRDDALLVVVYLSDEEDQSGNTSDEYLTGFQSLKTDTDKFRAFSIVLLPTDTAQNQWETVGSRYIELAEDSGGKASSIKEDFHTVLSDIGGTIVDLLTSFQLTGVPANADITVEVDGVIVENGWRYDEVTRSIIFDNGTVPDAGSIVIVYYYQCGGS
jgi:hypothetical protein